MEFFEDPILMSLLGLALVVGVVALRPQRWAGVLLPLLAILLFALPRAGLVVRQASLPLPLAHLACAALIAEWLVLRRPRPPEGTLRLGRYFLLYAAVAGFGLAVGLINQGRYLITFLELCFYLFSIGLFFYASDTFRQPQHFRRFVLLLLVISALVSVYGIAQRYLGAKILVPRITYNTGGSLVSRTYLEAAEPGQMRVLSSYGDPNVLASQLLVFIGVALALLLGRRVSGGWRWAAGAVLAANVVCLWFTRSRAGLVGLLLVPLVVLVWRSRWALLLLPVLGLAGVMAFPLLLEPVLRDKFQGLLTGEDVRALFPRMAWQLLNVAPLGCGLGQTVVLQAQGSGWNFAIVPAGAVWAGFNSFWLNLFCRLGAPGLLAFALLLAAPFGHVWRRARRVPDGMVQAALIGALAGFAGQWFVWLANNTYMMPGGGLNFWFTMGMLVAGCRAYAPEGQAVVLPTAAWSAGVPAAAATRGV